MNLFLFDKTESCSMIAHLKTKFHLINDLKINILVNMNIINSKNMILNFENRFVMISICKNIEISMIIQKKKHQFIVRYEQFFKQ